MSDDPILSLAEALTEIRRLRARILELEASAAITMGTLEKPTEAEPTRFEWNVPPSTPPMELP